MDAPKDQPFDDATLDRVLAVILIGILGLGMLKFDLLTPSIIQYVSWFLWPIVFLVMAVATNLRAYDPSVVGPTMALIHNTAAVLTIAVLGGGIAHGWTMLTVEGLLRLLAWVQNTERKTLALVLAAPVTALIGGFLFLLRLRIRSVYGAAEILAGLAVALLQVDTMTSAGGAVTIQVAVAYLTASLYLFVRGADNVHTALKAEEPDFVVKWLRARAAITPVQNPE